MANATASQGWFLDIEIRFMRTVDMEPPVGKWVLVVDAAGDFNVASIVVQHKGTERETREWYDGERYWDDDSWSWWAELPEFWKGG